MGKYANQWDININKEPIDDTTNYYMRIQKEALFNAMSVLDKNPLQLYLYLSAWNKDKMSLSSSDVKDKIGLSGASYLRAKKALIEKKYLIEIENSNNLYFFFQRPRTDAEIVELQKNIALKMK